MNEKSFSIGDAVGFGWETVKSNIGFFISLLIVAFLIQLLPGIAVGIAEMKFPVIAFILNIIAALIGYVVQMGLVKVSLKFCDGIKGKLDDLLSSFHLLLKFIGASILYALIVMGGLLLLIVPGIIWAFKYSLFLYFIVDRELGPIEALKASGEATYGAKFRLFLFGMLLGLINMGGALLFFVGLFITVPLSMVAYAYVFRELAGDKPEPRTASGDSGRKGPVVTSKADISENGMYINLGLN